MPTPGTGVLAAVSAVASNDVWAVGRTFDNPGTPLMLHWDGTSWATVTPPTQYGRLTDITMRRSG